MRVGYADEVDLPGNQEPSAADASDDDRAIARQARHERTHGDPERAVALYRELASRDTLLGRLAALCVVEIHLDLGHTADARAAAHTLLPLDRASYEAIAAVLEGAEPRMPASLIAPVLADPDGSAVHWLLGAAAVMARQGDLVPARSLLARAASLEGGEGRRVRWRRVVIEALGGDRLP
jgi:hypothetical protein